MAESSADDSADEGLRVLLDVEQRLQLLIRAAREDAARRVKDARAAGEQRLAAARLAAEQADAEQARAERVIHERALAEIDAAHRAALLRIARISDSRTDQLARWALTQAIAVTEPTT